MADNFTHFSCVLDVGTPDHAARALDLYPAFMEKAGREGAFAGGFLVSIHPDGGGTRIWMRDDVTGDPLQAIVFVEHCAEVFGLKGRWGLQWANVCSQPQVNAFSGGAHILDLATRKPVASVHTNLWLTRALRGSREMRGE
jgi:hypothetical protein